MPAIDPDRALKRTGSGYPEPYANEMRHRSFLRLGDVAGLTQFGVNLVTIQPGGKSSLRHWHRAEDEFVYVTAGEFVLVEDEGETLLRPGDMAAFKAGVANGHHLLNRSNKPASFLVVGSRAPDETATYPDDDLIYQREDGRGRYTRRDGTFLKDA